MTDNRFKKVISTIMAVTIAFTGLTLGAPSYAANRKPSSTSVTSIKAINNGFTVKWKEVLHRLSNPVFDKQKVC